MNRINENKNLIVGLDIGTSKMVAIVAEVMPDGGSTSSAWAARRRTGLKKGVVVNIEATVQSIQRALEGGRADGRLQDHARSIPASPAATSAASIRRGMVAIKDKEVTPADVDARRRDRARRSTFRTTSRCCTSCRRNSSSTARKTSASRSA